MNFGNNLTKNRILMLDIIANNNWEKPIYFTGGAQADEEYIWLKDWLIKIRPFLATALTITESLLEMLLKRLKLVHLLLRYL